MKPGHPLCQICVKGISNVPKEASQVVLVAKNLPASAGDIREKGLIPGSGRSPGEGNGNPLQYSCLENPMDGGAWWATVHGVAKSETRLNRGAWWVTVCVLSCFSRAQFFVTL